MEDKIIVTDIQHEDGVNKNGKPYVLWKVYDQLGLNYSGFNEPKVDVGQAYAVNYTQSGQFKNFVGFKPIDQKEVGIDNNAERVPPVTYVSEKAKNIEKLNHNNVAVELTGIAIENRQTSDYVVDLWKEIKSKLGDE